MDMLVRLIDRLARLVYKSYVFSTLRLHDSVNLAWPGIKSTFWYEIDVHDIMTFKKSCLQNGKFHSRTYISAKMTKTNIIGT